MKKNTKQRRRLSGASGRNCLCIYFFSISEFLHNIVLVSRDLYPPQKVFPESIQSFTEVSRHWYTLGR